MKTTFDSSISVKSEWFPKEIVVVEYVESTNLSNIYYKRHKAVLEITTDTEMSYHSNSQKGVVSVTRDLLMLLLHSRSL